ncbi:MAG: hypothetical protein QNJ58_20500 [Desulfobacterales bacterium]|nr:hypothetical protein [Desulfobacterales bacterium]
MPHIGAIAYRFSVYLWLHSGIDRGAVHDFVSIRPPSAVIAGGGRGQTISPSVRRFQNPVQNLRFCNPVRD